MNGEEFVNEWLVPFLTILILIGGITVILIKLIGFIRRFFYSKTFYDFKYKIIYNIFKIKVNQSVIEWCVDAKNKNLTDDEVRKRMLIKGGYNLKTIEEVVYLYRTINPPQKIDKTIKYKDLPELEEKNGNNNE